MADGSTLMAYLVPRLTKQVENAATDALADSAWVGSLSPLGLLMSLSFVEGVQRRGT